MVQLGRPTVVVVLTALEREPNGHQPPSYLLRSGVEKDQIQALDRTAPILPMRPGLPERATHDYHRYGTTNLHAALDVASGNVITGLTDRHRAVEFRAFLNQINRALPADLDVHLVVDNSSTHKTLEILGGGEVEREAAAG